MKLILNGGGIGQQVADARKLLTKKYYTFPLRGQIQHIMVVWNL